MTFTLAIETSGASGSVALGTGTRILESRSFQSAGRHAVDLLPTIADLCATHHVAPKEIALVCVSQGPGSFTGLRLGITVARMVAWANGARVGGVPTLTAIAQNASTLAPRPPHVVAMLDARRKNVYAACFVWNGQEYEATTESAEVNPEQFLRNLPHKPAVLGEGVPLHRSTIESVGCTMLPAEFHAARADYVYQLGVELAAAGKCVDHRNLTPTYVRLPEPEEKWALRYSTT